MDFVRMIFSQISIKTKSIRFLFRDNMGQDADEQRAQQMFDKATKIEQQFGDFFTSRTNFQRNE